MHEPQSMNQIMTCLLVYRVCEDEMHRSLLLYTVRKGVWLKINANENCFSCSQTYGWLMCFYMSCITDRFPLLQLTNRCGIHALHAHPRTCSAQTCTHTLQDEQLRSYVKFCRCWHIIMKGVCFGLLHFQLWRHVIPQIWQPDKISSTFMSKQSLTLILKSLKPSGEFVP